MNALKILRRKLSGKSKLLLVLFFLMSLGLITFCVSPFLLIWSGWDIAWRVGLTGLLSTVILFLGWWFLYNSFWTTIDAINNEQD